MAGAPVAGRQVVTTRGLVTGRPLRSVVGTPVVTPTDPTPTPDPPPAAVISGIVVSDITTSGATIRWNLAAPGPGWVEFGLVDGGPYPSETTHEDSFTYASHAQNITGQPAATPVYFRVVAVNGAGVVTRSTQQTFTTAAGAPADPPPPDPGPGVPIFGTIVESNLTDTGCTLTIPVDQPCQLQVFYDVDSGTVAGDYANSTNKEMSFTYSTHVQSISGIAAGTKVYYRAVATNAAGLSSTSAEGDFTTTGAPPPPVEGDYPAQVTLSYVAPTSVALPNVGVSTLDPTWGTHYTRVGSGTRSGHQYASHKPWNADETWFYDHYASQLLDASTYALVASRGRPSEPIWAYTDRLRMYGMSGKTFGYMNMGTGTFTTLYSFPSHTTVNMGNSDGGFSWDDRYFLFRGITSGGQRQMLVLDRMTGGTADNCTIVATLNITNDPDNYRMSASGQRAIINWENNNGTGSNQGVWLYNFTGSALTAVRQLNPDGDHGDCGKDINGNDIYVMLYNHPTLPNVYAYRMDQATSALDVGRLLPQTAGNVMQNGHLSMQAYQRPGYVYLASFKGNNTNPGRGQVMAVPTDGSAFADGNPIEVFGFHRSDSSDISSGTAYENSPMACPNKDGTKVAIKSKWSTADAPSTTFRAFVLSA